MLYKNKIQNTKVAINIRRKIDSTSKAHAGQ